MSLFRASAVRNAKIHGFNQKCLDITAKEQNFSIASSAMLKPADLALETCKILNSRTLSYLNGELIQTEFSWLPEEHKTQNLKYNLTKALQMRFALLYPYKENWDEVSLLFIKRSHIKNDPYCAFLSTPT